TNPGPCLSVEDLIGLVPRDRVRFAELCQEKKALHYTAALYPPSSSRERALFEKLALGERPLPRSLMEDLVERIGSGELDLRPGPRSGWYDHQVYALETLLLPERGEEGPKLEADWTYTNRLRDAFQGFLTKRADTHVRSRPAEPKSAPVEVPPR